MKVNRKNLVPLLTCLMILLSHISCSLEKIKAVNAFNTVLKRIKSEKSRKIKTNPKQQSTEVPTTKVDDKWLSTKFKLYEEKFENYKEKHKNIYSIIMLIIGFFSNLPEALINKLEKYPGFKAALKLLKSFASLFASIRPVTSECISGFEELKSFFSFTDNDTEKKVAITEENMTCEINSASTKTNIKDFHEISFAAKMHLSKFYFDTPDISYKQFDSFTEAAARVNPKIASSKTDFAAPKCQDLQKLREANTVKDTEEDDNKTDKSEMVNYLLVMVDLPYISPKMYIKKDLAELKAEFKDKKEKFFKDFNYQTELRIEAMVDPSNYMLNWNLLEITLCPYKKYHYHIRALCFEAMLHRYNPKLIEKLKNATEKMKDPANIQKLKEADKEFLPYQDKLTKYIKYIGITQYYLKRQLMLSNSLAYRLELISYQAISKREAAEKAFKIRSQAKDEKWSNASILEKLTDLEVINYMQFSMERRKDPSFLNKIFNKMKSFVEYSYKVIKSIFKSNEEILPSNESVLLPNLDLYTQGLGTKTEEYTSEMKLNILVGFQCWFRMLNLVRSRAVENVINGFLNTQCVVFGQLPLFDLSEIIAENTCFKKFKFQKNIDEQNGIIKIVGDFFKKVGNFIKLVYNLYFNCVNPLYLQFRDINEYSRKLSKAEFMKDFNKVLGDVKSALNKNPTDYNANMKNYQAGGFTPDSAKLLALADQIDSTLKELEKNPDIKKQLDQIKNEAIIVVLGDESVNTINKENLEEVNQTVSSLKNELEQGGSEKDKSGDTTNKQSPLYNKDETQKDQTISNKDPETDSFIESYVGDELEISIHSFRMIKGIKDDVQDKQKTDAFNELNPEMNSSLKAMKVTDDFKSASVTTVPTVNVVDSKSGKVEAIVDPSSDAYMEKALDAALTDDMEIFQTAAYLQIRKQHPEEAKKLEGVITTTMANVATKKVQDIKKDAKKMANDAANLYNNSKKLLTQENSDYEKLKLMYNIKTDAMRLYSTGPKIFTKHINGATLAKDTLFELNHQVNIAYSDDLIDFVKDPNAPLLGKAVAELSMATDIYKTHFEKDVLEINSIVKNYKKTDKEITKHEKTAKNVLDKLEKMKLIEKTDLSRPVRYIKTANQLYTGVKLGIESNELFEKYKNLDDKRMQVLRPDSLAGPKTEQAKLAKQAQSTATKTQNGRFKELLVSITERKNKKVSKSETHIQSKAHMFSKDPTKDAAAKKQVNDAYKNLFMVKELKDGLFNFFYKVSNFSFKVKTIEMKYYQKVGKYFEVIRNISSLVDSMKKILPAKVVEFNGVIGGVFGGDKCTWMELLAKQILSVPVLKFISQAWDLYNKAKIVYKVFQLLTSALQSQMPDRMFYVGQFISELINLILSLSGDTSCKKPEVKARRIMFRSKKLRMKKEK